MLIANCYFLTRIQTTLDLPTATAVCFAFPENFGKNDQRWKQRPMTEEQATNQRTETMSIPAKACPSSGEKDQKAPPKPCCACPETRKARDECVLFNGEESCQEFIEKHRECMRGYGLDFGKP